MPDDETTRKSRRSIYESDDQPTPSDKRKSVELYYQDGAPCPEKMAAELAMHRRYSVRHHRDIQNVERKIDHQGLKLQDVHTICMGNESLNVVALPAQLESHRSEQRQQSDEVNKKLNYIMGGIGVVTIVVPIIIMLIVNSGT